MQKSLNVKKLIFYVYHGFKLTYSTNLFLLKIKIKIILKKEINVQLIFKKANFLLLK